MPIREFCCGSCQHIFEELVRNDEEKNQLTCPKCGSKNLSTLFSVFGVAGAEKKVKGSTPSCSHCSSHNCSSCS
ncbi:MAG: zinc ribbon domain-containing protein [candidate division WOR-3 bacterium]